MPGLCIKAQTDPTATLADEVSGMLDRLKHHPWYTVESWRDESSRVALGRVSLGFVDKARQPVASADGTLTAMLAGELYDVDSLRRELGVGSGSSAVSHAELLLRGYQRDGTHFLRRLNGMFIAALWDAKLERLTICNDRFGMKPFYYAHLPGKLLAAAEIKALLPDPDLSQNVDMRGVAQFFTFGHLLGENTMREGVRMLPPASVLTYDVQQDRAATESYWQLPVDGSQNQLRGTALLDAIDQSFGAAVTRCVEGTDHLGLALSGGLDARSILALINHEQVRLKTISMGVPGSLDHRCAAAMAAMTNRDHHEYLLDGTVCDCETYGRNMRRMVHLTDGHYLDQVIVTPMLPYYRDLGVEVLLRGHAGELMHMNKAYNFSLDATAWQIRDEASLQQWLMSRLSGWMLLGVPEPVLCGISPQEVHELALDSLRAALAESAATQPLMHRIWHLFIRHRLPRETAMSLAKIGTTLETRVPFLDASLVELLLTVPPETKVGEEIQTYILRRHRPEFLKVVNANTGARMGAGPTRQRLATLKMKVLAKLGVAGYQPYERLGLWLRRELKPLVASILLEDRCLERGVFHPDAVRNVVNRHWANQANHTFLIMAMMIYELGQREFVDREPVPTESVSS